MHADDWTILSMLQSITLYILLRIFDQDSFSVDFDRELVRSMYVSYNRFHRSKNEHYILTCILQNLAIKAEQYQLVCQAEVEGVRPDWKEWVLLESKRRLVLRTSFLKNTSLLIDTQNGDGTVYPSPII